MRSLLLVFVVACGAKSTPSTVSGAGSATSVESKTCATDADCALVDACCNCTGGGERLAIRKDGVENYNATCLEGSCAVQPAM